MTRRSFCFLFGSGIGALALGKLPSVPAPMSPARLIGEDVARMFQVPVEMIMTQTSLAFDLRDLTKGLGPPTGTLSGFWEP
jgi:hypothetical protein